MMLSPSDWIRGYGLTDIQNDGFPPAAIFPDAPRYCGSGGRITALAVSFNEVFPRERDRRIYF
jgi:hypothetical protein